MNAKKLICGLGSWINAFTIICIPMLLGTYICSEDIWWTDTWAILALVTTVLEWIILCVYIYREDKQKNYISFLYDMKNMIGSVIISLMLISYPISLGGHFIKGTYGFLFWLDLILSFIEISVLSYSLYYMWSDIDGK